MTQVPTQRPRRWQRRRRRRRPSWRSSSVPDELPLCPARLAPAHRRLCRVGRKSPAPRGSGVESLRRRVWPDWPTGQGTSRLHTRQRHPASARGGSSGAFADGSPRAAQGAQTAGLRASAAAALLSRADSLAFSPHSALPLRVRSPDTASRSHRRRTTRTRPRPRSAASRDVTASQVLPHRRACRTRRGGDGEGGGGERPSASLLASCGHSCCVFCPTWLAAYEVAAAVESGRGRRADTRLGSLTCGPAAQKL
eukprot:353244-Chlamydomonas_euryale.AAC.13